MNQEEFEQLGVLLNESKKKFDTAELEQSEAYDLAVRTFLMDDNNIQRGL